MSEKPPASEGTGLIIIPAENATEEQRATLSVHYTDGAPTLVVTDGTAIPTHLTVTDPSGTPVATYAVVDTEAPSLTRSVSIPKYAILKFGGVLSQDY